MPVRAVVYARVSTNDQAGSIDQQLAWAGPKCDEMRLGIVGTFTDTGKSGHATAKRTGFHDMLAFCQAAHRRGEPVSVIVCWHANRFSRADSIETGWFLHEFRKAGVEKLLTEQRWIDFAKMEDRILLGIEQDASSNKFSYDLAEASTRGKISKARAGGWLGGRVPYGYRLQFKAGANERPEPDKLVIDPETASVVRRLFSDYAAGQQSLRTLVAGLNDRGEPTPSAREGRGRKAARWSVACVRNILTSETYLGTAVWNKTHQGAFLGVVKANIARMPRSTSAVSKRLPTLRNDPADRIMVPDAHEAVIDPDTFALVQRRLARQRTSTTPTRGGGDALTLTGLLWCGHCSRRMVGRHQRGVPLYLCGSYLEYGKRACSYNRVTQEEMQAALVRKLAERFTEEFFDGLESVIRAESSDDTSAAEIARDRHRLADLESKLARAARRAMVEEDDALAATYRSEVKRMQEERDRLAGEIARGEEKQARQADPLSVLEQTRLLARHVNASMRLATPAEARAVLRDHIEKVELHFTHEEKGRERRCRFLRGAVWLHEDSPLSSCLSKSLGTSSGSEAESTTTGGTLTPRILLF